MAASRGSQPLQNDGVTRTYAVAKALPVRTLRGRFTLVVSPSDKDNAQVLESIPLKLS
ncbi:hypothetical protein [Actinobaculum suis]|uniref:hypothetical protein n=1 Tax=Actinobaculum suis TaxID=1657 RepID=UPI00159ED912|nr:hypothetical protein [Actinobaculum suis]